MFKLENKAIICIITILFFIILSIGIDIKMLKDNSKNKEILKIDNNKIQRYNQLNKKFNYGDMIEVFNNDNNFNLLNIYEDINKKDNISVDIKFVGELELLERKLYEKSKKENFYRIDSISIINSGNNNIEGIINMKFIKNK